MVPSRQPFRLCFPSSFPDGKGAAGCPAGRGGIAYDETGLQKEASWFAVSRFNATGHCARSPNAAYEALEPFVAGGAFAALAIAPRTVASVRLTICWVAFENCS